jgi:hypothetical protein
MLVILCLIGFVCLLSLFGGGRGRRRKSTFHSSNGVTGSPTRSPYANRRMVRSVSPSALSMSDPRNPFGWTNMNSPNNPNGWTNMNSPNNPNGWNNPSSPNYFGRKQ